MSPALAKLACISPSTNPFSTRWVRPGALPYQFPRGADAALLVSTLRQSHWRACVVGPHGSGKSALLATLCPEIERSGRIVRSVTLHDRQRQMPADFAWPARPESPGVIVIDGYEQLGWRARRRLGHVCRDTGWGRLVTVHNHAAAPGFPVLFRTSADLAVVLRLIDRHLPPQGNRILPADVVAAFRAHDGNVRETFFALYDLFESRRAASSPLAI